VSQIGRDHFRVGPHLGGRTLGDLSSLRQDDDARTQPHDKIHIVLDDHESCALFGIDRPQPLLQMAEHRQIYTARWLVQHDESRSGHESHCGIQQLLLSINQPACLLSSEMLETEESNQAVRIRRQVDTSFAEQTRHHRSFVFLTRQDKIVPHRELGKDLKQLESSAYTPARHLRWPHSGDFLAIERHSPLGWPKLAENAIEQCRLAAAARPDDAEKLAFARIEANIVDGRNAAEALTIFLTSRTTPLFAACRT
jgi:hypothetical protein